VKFTRIGSNHIYNTIVKNKFNDLTYSQGIHPCIISWIIAIKGGKPRRCYMCNTIQKQDHIDIVFKRALLIGIITHFFRWLHPIYLIKVERGQVNPQKFNHLLDRMIALTTTLVGKNESMWTRIECCNSLIIHIMISSVNSNSLTSYAPSLDSLQLRNNKLKYDFSYISFMSFRSNV